MSWPFSHWVLVLQYVQYEPVQAYRPKLCPPQTPHATAARMSRIQYHTDLHGQRTVEEGDIARFVGQDQGQALVAKTCPHRPQAFQQSQ